jgi:hypothetical protein
MRKALGVITATCLAVAPCALAGPDDDMALAQRAEAMADRDLRRQEQGEAGPRLFGGIQTWYLVDWRNDAPDGEDDVTHGFVMRRVKLGVEKDFGDLHYRVNGLFSRGSEGFFLEDAWAGVQAGDFLIRAGQFKVPFVYEENVLWHDQLAAERSYTAEFFRQGYSQGIEFQYDAQDAFRAKFAATDGFLTANSDFDARGEADFAFTGRADWMLRGDWDAVDDFTSEFGGPEALRVGVAAHHQVAGRTGGFTDRTDVWAATADAQWERNGLSLYGAFIVLKADAKDAGFDLVDLGVVGQVGYRYNRRNEVFGRVDAIVADDRPRTLSEDQIILTAGYNHYLDGASARFTADVLYFATETGNTLVAGSTRQGFLRDEGSPQIVLRLALQFLF